MWCYILYRCCVLGRPDTDEDAAEIELIATLLTDLSADQDLVEYLQSAIDEA